MKTVLKAEVIDGIRTLSVDSQHPIDKAIPEINHVDAFLASQMPQELKEQILQIPSELNIYLSAIFEVMLYTKKSFAELIDLVKVEVPVERDWNSVHPDPDDQESLDDFYKKTEAFIYDGMANHTSPPTMATLGEVVRICLHFGLKEMLDWGAGVGTLTILLNKYGIQTHHVDLPGKTLEFARWRYRLRAMDVNVIPLPHLFTTESVDGIVCLEVVEHVKEPVEMLKKLHRIIRPGGILICSESCAQLEYSSHLKTNASFSGEAFIEKMNQIGFQLIPEFSRFYPKTYQRI
ncbi:MAG: hypothetical protein DRH17_00920 [Deltaproteobacteria bacterium]|nr:MAG: hypothetical protein DRH17_00920 [Deltaproteobacteria bacterium]